MRSALLALALAACGPDPASYRHECQDAVFSSVRYERAGDCTESARITEVARDLLEASGLVLDGRLPGWTLLVRDSDGWDSISGNVVGLTWASTVEVTRDRLPVLHEMLHAHLGVTSCDHPGWVAGGQYALTDLFEWIVSGHANDYTTGTSMPPTVESRLRAAGFGPALDATRAEVARAYGYRL